MTHYTIQYKYIIYLIQIHNICRRPSTIYGMSNLPALPQSHPSQHLSRLRPGVHRTHASYRDRGPAPPSGFASLTPARPPAPRPTLPRPPPPLFLSRPKPGRAPLTRARARARAWMCMRERGRGTGGAEGTTRTTPFRPHRHRHRHRRRHWHRHRHRHRRALLLRTREAAAAVAALARSDGVFARIGAHHDARSARSSAGLKSLCSWACARARARSCALCFVCVLGGGGRGSSPGRTEAGLRR